jgi:anti-anti-sigma regulatory factor
MATPGSCLFTISRSGHSPRCGVEADVIVVWLTGVQDASCAFALSRTVAHAMSFEVPLVVDLSRVEMMNAAAVDLFIRTAGTLQRQSLSLTLRSTPEWARDLFGACLVGDTLHPREMSSVTKTGTVLRGWLATLVTDVVEGHPAGCGEALRRSAPHLPSQTTIA